MADGPGQSIRSLAEPFPIGSASANASVTPNNERFGLDIIAFTPCKGPQADGTPVSPAPQDFPAQCHKFLGDDWYGNVHVVPRFFSFGNILGTIVRSIDVFNANLDTDVTWSAFVNNAGVGLSITDLPSLPTVIKGLNGLSLTLEVTTEGAPSFDTTIDFVFNVGTILVPVSGRRVIVFPYPPEVPLVEELEFLTDVLEVQDGTEQRIALRKNPRQSFDMTLSREEGAERSRIEFLLYDWQARAIGLPMWHESTVATSPITALDTVINVASTDFADYRVGGLAIILGDDEVTFDALEIDSLTSTTITFKTGTTLSFSTGAVVMPVRTAVLEREFTEQKSQVGNGNFGIRARVQDNDSNLGNTAAFNTFDGAVLLDGFNILGGSTLQETYEMSLTELDAQIGVFSHQTNWDHNKRRSFKGFKTTSREELWNVRRLLHALRGRQVAFWLPTFYTNIVPTNDLNTGSSVIEMENVGYTRFVRNRDEKNMIRVTTTSGAELLREIITSSEITSATEQLTVDTAWASTITIAEVARIEFYEKVRIDADTIRIEHVNDAGHARIIFPVRQVFA